MSCYGRFFYPVYKNDINKRSKAVAPLEAIMHQEDMDPLETQEWIEALDSVMRNSGKGRAAFLLKSLAEQACSELFHSLRVYYRPFAPT